MEQRNDKEARFLNLINQYKSILVHVCFAYCGSNASFDDLYQEVAINIWLGLDTFRGDCKTTTWLYRIAVNTCISWHRKNKRHGAENNIRLAEIEFDAGDDSTAIQQKEEWQMLQKLISGLGEVDKAIVSMWLDECSYEEIAEVTGLSPNHIGVRLHRIKQRFSNKAQ